MIRCKTLVVAMALAAALGSVQAAQDSAVAAPSAQGQAATDAASRRYFTDLELVNQDGEKVRFFSDVLKGKVVLINFIYTNCPDACPMLTHKLTQVKDGLGDTLADRVRFISISIDPEQDTPAALRKFAKEQRADRPGWVFLTGDKKNVDTVVTKLGQYSPDKEYHSTLLLAGNVNTRHWAKISPQTPVPAIVLRLQELAREG